MLDYHIEGNLAVEKFGEFTEKHIWQKKIWQSY